MLQTRRSFRLVCAPEEIPLVEDLLRAQGYAFEPDPFFPPARRLTAEPRPLGTSLAAFFGFIYIQDRASMLPPVALRPPEGAAVLDMCSSPGSKTGQLAGMVGLSGLVLGNEPNPARLATLRRNLHTMNLAQVVTCCHKGEALPLPNTSPDAGWDYIQLDPPCSGWGTAERNPKVLDIWTGKKIEPLVRLQRDLLREAARLLRPGGVAVYSTCTTNPAENEEQIRFAMDEAGLALEPLAPVPGFDLEEPRGGCPIVCQGVWRLHPKPGDTQGFFVARLRKPGSSPSSAAIPANEPPRWPVLPAEALAAQGVDGLPGPVGMFGDSLHALPLQALALPPGLRWQGLYVGKTGKGGEIRISPRLRFAGGPQCGGPRVDLEGADGLAVLKALLSGRSLTLPLPGADIPPGTKMALLSWNGLPLGRAGVKNGRLLWAER